MAKRKEKSAAKRQRSKRPAKPTRENAEQQARIKAKLTELEPEWDALDVIADAFRQLGESKAAAEYDALLTHGKPMPRFGERWKYLNIRHAVAKSAFERMKTSEILALVRLDLEKRGASPELLQRIERRLTELAARQQAPQSTHRKGKGGREPNRQALFVGWLANQRYHKLTEAGKLGDAEIGILMLQEFPSEPALKGFQFEVATREHRHQLRGFIKQKRENWNSWSKRNPSKARKAANQFAAELENRRKTGVCWAGGCK